MAALLAILSSLKIGLGLPNSDKSLHNGRLLVDIARRAEQLGFSTLGTIGRVAFPSYEELITLGAAAAVTERTGLMTDILLAATWEPVLLAKQAATLDQISGGRFVLGIGAGGRPDDFSATGFGFDDRGKRLDAALDLMHRAWRGETIPGTGEVVTPRPVNGHSVPVMFGGQSENAVRRVAKHGIGYTLGGGDPTALSGMMERVNAAWRRPAATGAHSTECFRTSPLATTSRPRRSRTSSLLRRLGASDLGRCCEDAGPGEGACQAVQGDWLRRADHVHDRARNRAGGEACASGALTPGAGITDRHGPHSPAVTASTAISGGATTPFTTAGAAR